MRHIRTIVTILICCVAFATFESCKEKGCTDTDACNYDPSADDDDGTCNYGCLGLGGGGGGGGGSTGVLTFWSSQNGAPISVNVSGYSGTITSYYAYDTPSCNASGCFSISLPYGSYSYTANDGTHNWSGTAKVSASCNRLQLYW
jgi:hypothetical protein